MFKHNPLDKLRVTSPFGPRNIGPAHTKFHKGIDLGAEKAGVQGDECYSVDDDGIVRFAGVNSGGVKVGYGNYIIIEYKDFCALYGHIKALEVKAGQPVKAGQLVAHMGNTGSSTGAHLHFEIRQTSYANFWTENTWVDPVPMMRVISGDRQEVQTKLELSEITMAYLDKYKYAESLYQKIAAKLR